MEAILNGDVLELVVKDNMVASNLDEQINAAKEAIDKNKGLRAVELNMKNVQEIDSLGINLVVGLYKQITSNSYEFSVTNTSRAIKNLFHLFKLNAYFDVS